MELSGLEKTFEEACDKHDHLKLLLSQWRFDRELIAKALQNIGSTFPHYSRHDASHSKQIIVNIERMLGDRIRHLTATDMWLILESAYCHDIGMVVTSKQILDMDTSEFRYFVEEIAAQPEHELNSFAHKWINGDVNFPSGSAAQSFVNEYKQLTAEWYRRKHPQNSAKIIRDPLNEIGLSSPRNELLPKRLFGALAAICNAHGEAFEEVMKLPFSEAGMATEDCHPRYIAFLLRMADLLDVDDNRFCPVMVRMSGGALPATSHAHLEKHQGIKHFRLDSERIKIEVVCPSPESYEVAHEWFKWLEKEYHSQSQHWPKIVPNKKLGRLPTLAPTKVSLEEPFLILNEGKRPSFELDQNGILKILRGTGLYSSKLDSIREVLQNAVDSTIIAIWEKHKIDIVNLDPASEMVTKLYDNSLIMIDFLPNLSDENKFVLTVQDQGMGISREDLDNMLNVGNSKKNSRRSRMIREMPDWFRPSGNFGIGLQSLKLLSDQFTMTTKSRATNDAYELTFNFKSGNSVLVKRLNPAEVEYGAKVAIDVAIEDFPASISIPWGDEGGPLREQINSYDFTQPGSNLKIYEQVKIFDAIREFNEGSPVKIFSDQQSLPNIRPKVFFSREESVSLSNVRFIYTDSGIIGTLFRGQKFSDLNFGFPLVSCVIDFHGYAAMDFLTYNRAKILPHMKREAIDMARRALLKYIEANFLGLSIDERPCAAAFYFLYSNKGSDYSKYDAYLKQYLVNIDGKGVMSLSEVIEALIGAKLIDFEIQNRHHISSDSTLPKNQHNDSVAVMIDGSPATSLHLIKLLGTKEGMFWQEQPTYRLISERCHWSHNDIIPVHSSMLFKLLQGGKSDLFEIGNRMIFPAWGKYRRLAIDAAVKWARIKHHTSTNDDYLLLPYKFINDGPAIPDVGSSIIDWVYTHRIDQSIRRDEIVDLYENLIADFAAICDDMLNKEVAPNIEVSSSSSGAS